MSTNPNYESLTCLASVPAERSVLGAVLEDESLLKDLTDGGLKTAHFSLEQHRHIFDLMVAMHTAKTPIDVISLAEKLGGQQEHCCLVGSLIQGVVVESSHILHHARIIRKKFSLRELAKMGEWLADYACIPSAQPDSIVAELKEKLIELGGVQ